MRVFKSDDTQVQYIEPYYDTSYMISLTAGDYYANIAAVNDHGFTFSDNIQFTVSSGTVTPIASAVLNGDGQLNSIDLSMLEMLLLNEQA